MERSPRETSWGSLVDGASYGLFRMAFGWTLVVEVVRYFALGWIERDFAGPEEHFAYFGLDALRPWPEPWLQVHFAVLGLAALGMALGRRPRLCAGIFALGFGLAFLWEKSTYQNHNYLIFLLAVLVACIPASRRPCGVPRWGLLLLRFQIAVPYVFGGIAKLGGDWLAGEPMGMWLAERRELPHVGAWFEEPWALSLFTWGGLVFDLSIVPLLCYRRTRAWAYVVSVLFHLTNHLLFQIGIFPWFMILGTTLFFEPDWPRRVVARLVPGGAVRIPPAAEGEREVSPLVGGLLVAWIVVQIALPFRHALYPGRVDWTEEGHRFAWHMKLRDKKARVHSITLLDPRTGATAGVDPRDYLTNRQITEMCAHPEMIRQFAHMVARRARLRGIRPQVRADVRVSLNGRAYLPLVDPEVDLLSVEPGLGPAEWIAPLTPGGPGS